MKKLALLCVALTALLPARAQFFSPEALNGALFGSLIGGLVGGSGNHGGCGYYNGCGNGFSGQGAAIGAGVGLAVGALASAVNQRDAYYSQPVSYAPQAYPQPGYGYAAPATAYSYAPPPQPNYAVNGTLVGAASGALIGAGNHQAGVGAGIGAAAGLVVGGIAQYTTTRHHKKTLASVPPDAAMPAQPQSSAPASLPQNQITSTPAPNSTYYWTAHVQIPDAPRVADAPTF